MNILRFCFLALVLVGCTTIEQSTRITTNLQAKEYNSISARYMNRPTFSAIEKMSDSSTVLAISRDNYGSTASPLRFSKDNVSGYILLIDKYFKWEKLAMSRGDAITKEIGKENSWGNTISGSFKFTFHSGNSAIHYLSISFCAAGTCLDDQALYFDSKNTQILKELLLQLSSGAVNTKSINSVYK